MLSPIELEARIQAAEYYFATLMDQLVNETMQLEPVDDGFISKVDELFYTIESIRFLYNRGIYTDNETCLSVYQCMMDQIGIYASLPDIISDTTLIIPGIVLPPSFQGPQGPVGPQGSVGPQGPQGNPASVNDPRSLIIISGSYTVTNGDYCVIFNPASNPMVTSYVTLPSAIGISGKEIVVMNLTPYNLYIQTVLSQKIKYINVDTTTSISLSYGNRYGLISDGSDWIITYY